MAPVMFAILLVTFMVSRSSPGDPVYLAFNPAGTTIQGLDRLDRVELYNKRSKELGLDLPIFYFEFTSMAYPDTLNRIMYLEDRAALTELTARCGNWEAVSRYYHNTMAFLEDAFAFAPKPEFQYDLDEIRSTLNTLPHTSAPIEIDYHLATIDSLMASHPLEFAALQPQHSALKAAYSALETEATPWKTYIPTFYFHGFKNQFHHWLMQILRFDFGESYNDRRSVNTKISEALPVSIAIGAAGYFLSYFIAIAIGMYAVKRRFQWQDTTMGMVLFLANSIPTFVICMLAMTFLCGPTFLHIFPVAGLQTDGSENWPFLYKFLDYLYHLILPTLIFSVSSMTGISRFMRISMIDIMDSDFVRTARAKGLSDRQIIRRHALPNALLPLINSISNRIPDIIMGAIVVETIFSLPGMGALVVDAQQGLDHPVVVAVFAIAGLATVVMTLVGDILFALADPRISFSKQ